MYRILVLNYANMDMEKLPYSSTKCTVYKTLLEQKKVFTNLREKNVFFLSHQYRFLIETKGCFALEFPATITFSNLKHTKELIDSKIFGKIVFKIFCSIL
jgi:hypothetical protein